MEKDEIKKMYEWIQSRVGLDDGAALTVTFDEPTAEDFAEMGFGEEAVELTLGATWWTEMVTDILETLDYAEPGETAEQILGYARDVVVEYVRKRLYT